MIAPIDQSTIAPRSRSSRKKILLVDDHPITRAGLAALIDGEPDLIVCAESDGGDAFKLAQKRRPDAVVVDLMLRNSTGFDVIRELGNLEVQTPILVVSMLPEQMHASRAIQSGAKGYLTKDAAASTFITALREVLGGRIYVSEKFITETTARLRYIKSGDATFPDTDLGAREAEILRLVGLGWMKREISTQLRMPEDEVRRSLDILKKKLRLRHLNDLLHFAVQRMRFEVNG
jgi:DNA-binding NarL/FixJ family response regulator